ncbi:hypothetical protein GCM10008174_08790 [Methylopila turkensis]|uniref:EthD domain-containing protein n=2 Tax=Methylopila turkensis TaxID=1437816 RepID=A0A9W6N670_9HYPH|nr:hypothetical protein GCM10008174_08790 [Methylopila turkensis]
MLVIYAGDEQTPFDRDHWINVHFPLVQKSWGPYGLVSVGGFFPQGDGTGLIAVGVGNFRDEAAMEAALNSPETAHVMADVDIVTAVKPQRSAWLIGATTLGAPPGHLWLVVLLFLTGFGHGLATPGLMHMVTGRVSPAFSGMIAGVIDSTLQASAALSVAVIGGVFYALSGVRDDAGQFAHAFVVALLVIAASQLIGACLGRTIARRPASDPARCSHLNDVNI